MNLLRHFPKDRFSFDIVVSEDDTAIFDDDLKELGARKIVTLKKKYGSPALRTAANVFSLWRVIREGNYAIAHFNVCHGVELVYVFLAKLAGIPKRIVHCRNNDIGAGGKSRQIKILAHKICKQLFSRSANVKLANSALAAKWLFTERDIRRGNVSVIHNGIEMEKYRFREDVRESMRSRLGVGTKTVVGHIGHFNYQKNHEFLLKIFAAYTRYDPESVLLLIGEGEEEEKTKALAGSLGIAEKVLFAGVTKDIPPYLWAMDVFVFPSRFEGFGNVLIEAQAAGLECFASKDVIPEAVQITDALNWIPLTDSAEEWAKKIASERKPRDRVGQYHTAAASRYSIDRMADALSRIYAAPEERAK